MPLEPTHVETPTHISLPESGQDTTPKQGGRGVFRALGLGLITGPADDDPSAIGTYASPGAKFGLGFLWTAPVTFPMIVAVVYLSSKLGLVYVAGTHSSRFAPVRTHP